MSNFFPYQRLRVDYRIDDDEHVAYQGPAEYIRPVNPDDEDILLPDTDEPLHFVRIVLGSHESEAIFPESAISAAPQRDLGGLMDRVHEMLDQIGPMMRYLDGQVGKGNVTRTPFASAGDSLQTQIDAYEHLRARLRSIADNNEA